MLSRILFGAALVVALASCTNEPAVPRPDLSGTDVDLTVLRFDRALAEVDTSAAGGGAAGAMSRLGGAFGDFTAVYFTHLIPLRRGDLSPAEQRAAFRTVTELTADPAATRTYWAALRDCAYADTTPGPLAARCRQLLVQDDPRRLRATLGELAAAGQAPAVTAAFGRAEAGAPRGRRRDPDRPGR